MRRLSDVPVELSVEIGRTRMTVGETLQLRPGSIVTLERLAGEPVDLLVNGTPIARGEVVVVDEQFGLRVTEVVEGEPATPSLGERFLPGAHDLAPHGPVQGDPVQGDPVQGDPVQGDPVQGDPVQSDPVQGDPVQGDPVQGDPVQGVPVQE